MEEWTDRMLEAEMSGCYKEEMLDIGRIE